MTDSSAKPVPAKASRCLKNYIVPPIVVPAALSIVLLIYMLVRGPA